MKKSLLVVGVGALILVAAFYILDIFVDVQKSGVATRDYKDATYMVQGIAVKLHNGVHERPIDDSDTEKIVTRYFGNELRTDLDGDGRTDVVFLITQTSSGSGTFYYVVGALNTTAGYVGTDAYFLGDRIAPQTTEMSTNPKHQRVIVVNYAVRDKSEPMTTPPSFGKSVYLKIDPATRQWGIVEANFEGESNRS